MPGTLIYVEEINSTGTFLYKTRKEAGSNDKNSYRKD